MRLGLLRGSFLFVALLVVPLVTLGAHDGICADQAEAAAHLVLNPNLSRAMPPLGWLADHGDAYVKQHPVYKQTCRTAEVVGETYFLNKIIANDEAVLAPPPTQLVRLSSSTIFLLRREIDEIDTLVTRLNALPGCNDGAAPPAMAAAAQQRAATSAAPGGPSPSPANGAAAPTTPSPAAATPAPPQPIATSAAPAAPSPPPADSTAAAAAPAPSAVANKASAPSPDAAQRIVIRFDDRLPALTPLGQRAFDAALDAARSGQKVEVTIEGCDAAADYTSGSPCARRRLSLIELFGEHGIRDPKRLLANLR
jgi:hypothetical protein